MRLGILPLGPLPDALAYEPLVAMLRAEDVDVVAPITPPTTADGTVAEAERIARADCDGVLLICREERRWETWPQREVIVRCALALAGYPLLLGGTFSPGFFDAAGALEEIGGGLLVDRLPVLSGALMDRGSDVRGWLTEHERRERQRGAEAARQLSRERLLVVGKVPDGVSFDPLQWLMQFGITLSSVPVGYLIESGGGYSPEVFRREIPRWSGEVFTGIVLGEDFPAGWEPAEPPACARDGDMDGALTHCLLRHLSAEKRVWSIDAGAALCAPPGTDPRPGMAVTDTDLFPEAATFVRLRRRNGRYVCDLFSGYVNLDRVPRFGVNAITLAGALGTGRVHYVPGKHIGAVRAACHALDIAVRRIDASP